jgi:hypothetical protein
VSLESVVDGVVCGMLDEVLSSLGVVASGLGAGVEVVLESAAGVPASLAECA